MFLLEKHIVFGTENLNYEKSGLLSDRNSKIFQNITEK